MYDVLVFVGMPSGLDGSEILWVRKLDRPSWETVVFKWFWRHPSTCTPSVTLFGRGKWKDEATEKYYELAVENVDLTEVDYIYHRTCTCHSVIPNEWLMVKGQKIRLVNWKLQV